MESAKQGAVVKTDGSLNGVLVQFVDAVDYDGDHVWRPVVTIQCNRPELLAHLQKEARNIQLGYELGRRWVD